jgi:hypothetical protein
MILTIMLNYVAYYLLLWMLRTPGLLQMPGNNQPQTAPTPASAQFPDLLGPRFPALDWGFVVVVVATVVVWWVIEDLVHGRKARQTPREQHRVEVDALDADAGGARRVRHRLRRDHRGPPRPQPRLGHLRRRHPVRGAQSGLVLDAGAGCRRRSSRRSRS